MENVFLYKALCRELDKKKKKFDINSKKCIFSILIIFMYIFFLSDNTPIAFHRIVFSFEIEDLVLWIIQSADPRKRIIYYNVYIAFHRTNWSYYTNTIQYMSPKYFLYNFSDTLVYIYYMFGFVFFHFFFFLSEIIIWKVQSVFTIVIVLYEKILSKPD